MTYQIKMIIPEYNDYDHHDAEIRTYEIPFGFLTVVYYAYKKRNKWVLRKSRIERVWATNMVGVRLDNNQIVCESEFNLLFVDMEEAIEFCLKKNQQEKVKIYNKGLR